MSEELGRILAGAAKGYELAAMWAEKYATLSNLYEEYRNHVVYREQNALKEIIKLRTDLADAKESVIKQTALVKSLTDRLNDTAYELHKCESRCAGYRVALGMGMLEGGE